jgi:hypothetical protein
VFLSHFNRMSRYRHFVDGGVMVGTDPTGVVSLDRRKRVQIDLTFSERDIERLVLGLKTLSGIYLAGGARRAFPSSYELLEFADGSDLDQLERRIRRADDLAGGSAMSHYAATYVAA